MKQYKKQVDGYKAQMRELKAEMDGLKAELGVYQQQTMQQRQQVCVWLHILHPRSYVNIFKVIV